MKIERSSFILLAGAIALGACTVVEDKDGDDAGVAGTGGAAGSTAGAAGEAGAAGSAAGAAGSAAGAAGEAGAAGSTAGAAGEAGAAGSAAGAAGEAGAAGAAGSTAGAAGEAGAAGSGGAACDDSVGAPKDCTPLEDCGAYFEFPYCETAVVDLKPKVAEATVDCLLTDACGGNAYECWKTALAAACPDPTADAICDEIVSLCAAGDPPATITAAECHGYLDGMTQAGREDMKACAQDYCSDGLWSCVEGL